MKNNRKQHYEGALLEEMNSKIDMIIEMAVGLAEGLSIANSKLEVLDSDMKIVKSVATSHSGELKDHRSRIHTLETRVFS